MAHPRRFRFGIQLSNPMSGLTWADSARSIESAGFSSLFMPDHFEDQLAPVPALMAAAAATTDLRVGALVFDNDYRHPVVLAKEIATLDLLSDGRVEFGLGAGWMRSDYSSAGMSYDAPKVRVERFFEGVEVMRQLWSDSRADFQGEHYTIDSLEGLPKPHTPGGPPLLIGAGAKRMLNFAGANADIVGINPSIHSGSIDADAARDAQADRFDQKVAWVKEGAGARFDDIELNALVFMANVTDDADGIAESMAPMFGVDGPTLLGSPAVVVGTVDEICERLEERRRRWGLSYYVFQADAMAAMEPVVARLTGN